MAKPKPGPSTGGKVTSKIDRPKGTQPLTLGTGGIRTKKVSKKQMSETRKIAGVVATSLIPAGKLAKMTASYRSKSAARKLEPGGEIIKSRKFKQGKDSITMEYPKKSGGGTASPIKGTKVNVTYKTKAQSPLQVATLTTGRVSRENTKKTVTRVKSAVQGGYVVDRINQANKKKEKKK